MIIISLSLVLLFIVNTPISRSSVYSEEIEGVNHSNTNAIKFKITLINHLGSVAIIYDCNKDASERFYLDFEIITGKEPFNLLSVSLNGVDIKPEVLFTSNKELRFEEGQYILDFDDSIQKTGFFVDLNSQDEYLKISELVREEDGINFCVQCIERGTGVIRNVFLKLSVEKLKKFFDLLEEYRKSVKNFS